MSSVMSRRVGLVSVLLLLATLLSPWSAGADALYFVRAPDSEVGYRVLITEETFEYSVEAGVTNCAIWDLGWGIPQTHLDFFVLAREDLGHDFQVGDLDDWRAISGGSRIDSLPVGPFECGDFGSDTFHNRRLVAPESPGLYYLTACLPAFREDGELVTSVFFRCSFPILLNVGERPAPDLIVAPLRVVPASPEPGSPIRLAMSVRNIGNGSSAETRLGFFVDGREIFHNGRELTARVPELEPGQVIDQMVRAEAPGPGTYEYTACVGTVVGGDALTGREQFDDNNCSRPYTVHVETPNPSETVITKLVLLPSQASPGSSVRVAVQAANFGSSPSAPVEITIVESPEPTSRDEGRPVVVLGIEALEPGAKLSEEHSIAAPATPGTYHYNACIGERCFGWRPLVVE